jgi:CO/xanthine dehydrogenase FAD-binding subunit
MRNAANLDAALNALAEGFQPIAGGTDLMVLFNAGKLPSARFVGIRRIPELHNISVSDDFLEIGASVTYTQLREHPTVCAELKLLAQAASWTGSIANQNRGTLGGNMANASPAADSLPPLLVYNAEVRLISQQGDRWVPYAEFHLGYKKLAMESGELIAAIRIPREIGPVIEYGRKVGTRRAQAIAKVSFAALKREEFFRIAIGSVAPVPLRCVRTEAFLDGERLTKAVVERAKTLLLDEISPITDIRSTRDYRTIVTGNLLGEFLEMLL